jgi:cytochrome d ubiquinol oxidase subunit I
MVIMEGMYLKTKNPLYEKMTKFWVKVFALTFAIGVATGIVMEFEFGTNWATYSRYVGDVFGSALAAEGIFAFFLESGFLAILVFGWDKVKPPMHFFSTIMVSLGAMFSAIWIVVANSWMQTPAGFHIVGEGMNARAEITDFWAMVFNPSSVDRLLHTISGCWLAGAFLVISVSAYYLLKERHIEFAKSSIKIALIVACFASLFQLFTGHHSAIGVHENQPAKLAAMEAVFDDQQNVPIYLFGWVNEENQKVNFGVAIPGMLSYMIGGSTEQKVTGLNSFSEEERPPVNIVFQAYHLMVAIGFTLIGISLLGIFFWWRGTLFNKKWILWIFIFSVLGPQIANQVGWITAEVGRQPWIVYGILRTSEGLSKAVEAGQVWFSLIMFTIIYLFLFILFIYLLNEKVQHGPEGVDNLASEYEHQKILFGKKN